MDLVDIDKVLDDLELNEDNTCRSTTVGGAPAAGAAKVASLASSGPAAGMCCICLHWIANS